MLTLVLSAVIALFLGLHGRARATPQPLHSATQASLFPRANRAGIHRLPGAATPLLATTMLVMARYRQQPDGPPARPIRLPFQSRDPLAKHRAVTGINAHVRWYQRIFSLFGIAVLVALMGVLVAVMVGAAFIAARVLLELLVG